MWGGGLRELTSINSLENFKLFLPELNVFNIVVQI